MSEYEEIELSVRDILNNKECFKEFKKEKVVYCRYEGEYVPEEYCEHTNCEECESDMYMTIEDLKKQLDKNNIKY